jgi:hypothetical protein
MFVQLNPNQIQALHKLKEAIAHSDKFNGKSVTDDEALFLCPQEVLLETSFQSWRKSDG